MRWKPGSTMSSGLGTGYIPAAFTPFRLKWRARARRYAAGDAVEARPNGLLCHGGYSLPSTPGSAHMASACAGMPRATRWRPG